MSDPHPGKRPGWRIVDAVFETSAAEVGQCPSADRPEVAFAGRSNVGKSSLINALTGRRGLARVSRTPGRTRLLNFFTASLHGAGALPVRLVDLPGYGFAAAHRSVRDAWGPMIEGYLADRDALAGLVLLIDARRGVGDLDLSLAELATEHGRPTLVVATKADKLGASKRGLVRRRIADAFGARAQDVLLTSAHSAMGLSGRDSLAADLAELVAPAPDPDPDSDSDPDPESEPDPEDVRGADA